MGSMLKLKDKKQQAIYIEMAEYVMKYSLPLVGKHNPIGDGTSPEKKRTVKGLGGSTPSASAQCRDSSTGGALV